VGVGVTGTNARFLPKSSQPSKHPLSFVFTYRYEPDCTEVTLKSLVVKLYAPIPY
jgi:hypothetical protein